MKLISHIIYNLFCMIFRGVVWVLFNDMLSVWNIQKKSDIWPDNIFLDIPHPINWAQNHKIEGLRVLRGITNLGIPTKTQTFLSKISKMKVKIVLCQLKKMTEWMTVEKKKSLRLFRSLRSKPHFISYTTLCLKI